tara:strand:- start:584 stop:1084 length:501 start_codon:yes stop_codon:yes gene_type:complete
MENIMKAFTFNKSTEPKTKWKEIYGGKGKIGEPVLDAHCWCELNGEVVYDPKYEEHKITQKLYKLTNKTIYKKFDPLLQKICFKAVNDSKNNNFYYEQIKEVIKKEENIILTDEMVSQYIIHNVKDFYKSCFLVAYAYKQLNPNVEIVCGSMGWLGKDGEPHWEFG